MTIYIIFHLISLTTLSYTMKYSRGKILYINKLSKLWYPTWYFVNMCHCTHMHSYMHTYMHSHMHTYMHTYIGTCEFFFSFGKVLKVKDLRFDELEKYKDGLQRN
ncbi:conserved Plasmodium protein, unknown function [Plasmodium malariae]|uniref:Very-long-chain 3-oxoacyl-CoA synthase n=1 Tax=Plasmodium malariae TaxID=5858 RepID=A0A1C3K9I4_PLAMA|nr:conserved Plasmodium protein, unknown function [Plasmodium malariae]